MSLTRKQRREQAAKAARTIQPVATVKPVDTSEMELRTAYRQVEAVEEDNDKLRASNRMLMDTIDQQDAAAQAQAKRLYGRMYWYFVGGLLLGYAISFIPNVAA
jgi:hypothetical protein